jgi:hypothetical protein
MDRDRAERSLLEPRFPLLPLSPIFQEVLDALLNLRLQLLPEPRAVFKRFFESRLSTSLDHTVKSASERFLQRILDNLIDVDWHRMALGRQAASGEIG